MPYCLSVAQQKSNLPASSSLISLSMRERMEMNSAAAIIPGLPNDVGMNCLLKVPRMYHACLASVCMAWRNAVRHPEFYRQRRKLGIADSWLVIISTDICSAPALLYSAYDLATKKLLFRVKFPPSTAAFKLGRAGGATQLSGDAVVEALSQLDHYRIVAMDEFFAVLGFGCQRRWQSPHCSLTIYNTVTDEWRLGAALSIWREMFACGAIGRRIYVAGGVNASGEAESTTEVYDFLTDTWSIAAPLPADGQSIQADAVFQGKLYVLTSSAYGRCCLWMYDPPTDTWQAEGGLPTAAQQLFATENSLYVINNQQEVYRLDHGRRGWSPAGQCLPSRLPCGGGKRQLPARAVYSQSSQIAFAHGNDVFFVDESSHRDSGVLSDSSTKCQRLMAVKPTWYHSGAVVSA